MTMGARVLPVQLSAWRRRFFLGGPWLSPSGSDVSSAGRRAARGVSERRARLGERD